MKENQSVVYKMVFEFVKSSRGGKLLKDRLNFLYYLKKDKDESSIFVCTEYKKTKSNCPVTATLDKKTVKLTFYYNHNHGTVKATKVLAKSKIEGAVKNSDVKTRKVLADTTTTVQNTEGTSVDAIPKKESIMHSNLIN